MAPHRSATKSLPIAFSSSGDKIVITASASGPLNIYCIVFTVDNATNVKIKDSVAGDLTGSFILVANGSSFTMPMSDEPWFQIQPGSDFIINSTSAVGVGGVIWFTTG